MFSRLPHNPSASEPNDLPDPMPGVMLSIRSTGQTLRVFGFHVVAFLLGIALAFM